MIKMPRASMQGYLGALLDNNVITRVANVFTTTWQNYADRASPR